jgi:succinoglycan biosynthesis transport protein ExoP
MQDEVSVSVNDLLKFLARGLLLALLVAAALGFIVFRISGSRPAVYEAQSTVYTSGGTGQLRDAPNLVFSAPSVDRSIYREAATNDFVIRRTLQDLANDPEAVISDSAIRNLRGRITVRNHDDRTSGLMYIRVRDSSPELAAQKATLLANALVEWDKARARDSIDTIVISLRAQIDELTNRIRAEQTANAPADQIDGLIRLRAERQQSLGTAEALRVAAVSAVGVLQPATAPSRPTSPRPVFDAAIAAILGVFLTYGLLLLRNSLDTRLRSVEDVAEVSGIPVIAEFPRLPRGIRNLPREPASYLRTNLLFSTGDTTPKVIMVASAQAEEGKSSIAISVSESFVRNGYRTLLVDADMRKPVIASEYRINNLHQAALEDCLKNPYITHQPATVSIGAKDYLYVIPSFAPTNQASELLSRGFRDCLERWRQEYDVIIVDTSPLLAVADALTIAPLCTGTLLAINQQKTDRRQLRAVVELLKRVGVRILGSAVTHVTRDASQQTSYGYGYTAAQQPNPRSTLIDMARGTVASKPTKQR